MHNGINSRRIRPSTPTLSTPLASLPRASRCGAKHSLNMTRPCRSATTICLRCFDWAYCMPSSRIIPRPLLPGSIISRPVAAIRLGMPKFGFCRELAGQFDEAENAYQAGIRRDPQNAPCRINYGLMLAPVRSSTRQFVSGKWFCHPRYITTSPAPARASVVISRRRSNTTNR